MMFLLILRISQYQLAPQWCLTLIWHPMMWFQKGEGLQHGEDTCCTSPFLIQPFNFRSLYVTVQHDQSIHDLNCRSGSLPVILRVCYLWPMATPFIWGYPLSSTTHLVLRRESVSLEKGINTHSQRKCHWNRWVVLAQNAEPLSSLLIALWRNCAAGSVS